MPTEWQSFFDAHAPHYDENPFTEHTVAEVDFFLNLFPIEPGATILDVGCGTGRHSAELARRGFKVTGVDISEGMLAEALKKSDQVEWIQADATQPLPLDGRVFDAAISLCEGGFGLIGQKEDPEEHDLAILRNIAAHLKPGGPFLLTAMNAYAVIRQMKHELIGEGRFDPATMVSSYEDEWTLPEGTRVMKIRERLFIPPEMVRMLREAGLRCDRVFGGTAGSWGQRPLQLDEIEAMYVCRRI